MTLARILRDTEAPGLKQRETADCDTRATRATSYEVARLPDATTGGFFLAAFTTVASPAGATGRSPRGFLHQSTRAGSASRSPGGSA
jgi:hypothetical protein